MRRFVPLALAVLAVGCPAPHAQVAPSTVFKLATRLPALSQANARNLSDIEWAERVYTPAESADFPSSADDDIPF